MRDPSSVANVDNSSSLRVIFKLMNSLIPVKNPLFAHILGAINVIPEQED